MDRGAIALLAQSVSVPMDRYSTASIAALQDMVTEWQLRQRLEADARRLGQDTELRRRTAARSSSLWSS